MSKGMLGVAGVLSAEDREKTHSRESPGGSDAF